MEPKIRIDQSHCNYVLSKILEERNWRVLFRDPGRVSRGASGTQEVVLGVFERSGLPIPDIAATKGENLLLIEVDKSAKKNESSFLSYRNNARRILSDFAGLASAEQNLTKMKIGFCKVGNERSPSTLMSHYGLDFLASFPDHIPPQLVWSPELLLLEN